MQLQGQMFDQSVVLLPGDHQFTGSVIPHRSWSAGLLRHGCHPSCSSRLRTSCMSLQVCHFGDPSAREGLRSR